ncbi:Flavin prenyltransferase UbiX [hydrothermal vent metagenome]|uniref:flavin prenyltransferase n=1 Tax=hydrothermal vent metagenome TaxID=652676 RepID=A0A3B1CBL4_9ZZZZ
MDRFIVGISGASGVIYGIRLLEALKKYSGGAEVRLIITPSAETNIGIETGYAIEQVKALADAVDDYKDFTAPTASGSFRTKGMVIAPCSMRTLSDIANSHSDNLLVRAADVTLKEGRKLVVVPRETPLHKGHLELMTKVADIGGVILPPFPAFYHQPKTIDDIIDQTVGKILDQLGVEHDIFKRWGE